MIWLMNLEECDVLWLIQNKMSETGLVCVNLSVLISFYFCMPSLVLQVYSWDFH